MTHATLCSSPEWAAYLHDEVLPPLVAKATLGDEMLEIGPGPGASTEWLRAKVARLVVVEIDDAAADRLVTRFAGTNVEVEQGDATDLRFR